MTKRFILLIIFVLLFSACSKTEKDINQKIKKPNAAINTEITELTSTEKKLKPDEKKITPSETGTSTSIFSNETSPNKIINDDKNKNINLLPKGIKNILPKDMRNSYFQTIDFEGDGNNEYVVHFESPSTLVQIYWTSTTTFSGFVIFKKDGQENWQEVYRDSYTWELYQGRIDTEKIYSPGQKRSFLKISKYQKHTVDELLITMDGENLYIGDAYQLTKEFKKNNEAKLNSYLKEGERFGDFHLNYVGICNDRIDDWCSWKDGPNLAILKYEINFKNGVFFLEENSFSREGLYYTSKSAYFGYFDGKKIEEPKTANDNNIFLDLGDKYGLLLLFKNGTKIICKNYETNNSLYLGEEFDVYYKEGKIIKKSEVPKNILNQKTNMNERLESIKTLTKKRACND